MTNIDEDELKKLIAGNEQPKTTPEIILEPKKGKEDFLTFFQINPLQSRHSIYVSEENYKRVSNLVRLIGTVTIGGYIDNIISAHFKQYGGEIDSLIRRTIKQLQ